MEYEIDETLSRHYFINKKPVDQAQDSINRRESDGEEAYFKVKETVLSNEASPNNASAQAHHI